jgi:hypothetical protein
LHHSPEENLLVVLLVMAPPSQELEPPINPERFTPAEIRQPGLGVTKPLTGFDLRRPRFSIRKSKLTWPASAWRYGPRMEANIVDLEIRGYPL